MDLPEKKSGKNKTRTINTASKSLVTLITSHYCYRFSLELEDLVFWTNCVVRAEKNILTLRRTSSCDFSRRLLVARETKSKTWYYAKLRIRFTERISRMRLYCGTERTETQIHRGCELKKFITNSPTLHRTSF